MLIPGPPPPASLADILDECLERPELAGSSGGLWALSIRRRMHRAAIGQDAGVSLQQYRIPDLAQQMISVLVFNNQRRN